MPRLPRLPGLPRAASCILALLLGAALALSACSSEATDDGPDDGPDDGRVDGSGGEPDPSDAAAVPLARCGDLLPDAAEAITLGDGKEVRIAAAEFGDTSAAETVLVLLHQTGSDGLCGWGPFATKAAEVGLPSIAFDLCDWGESTCPDGMGSDAGAQVDLAVAHARDALGGSRVVLVGASMGGSMTVMAVASGVDVDAWVDVSGPSSWDGVLLADLAPQVAQQDVPGVVVQATSDGQAEYAAAKALARDSSAEFLDGGDGHGYELLVDPDGVLLPAGQAILDLARTG